MATQQTCLTPRDLLTNIDQHLQEPVDSNLLADLTTRIANAYRSMEDRPNGNVSADSQLQSLGELFGRVFFNCDKFCAVRFEWCVGLLQSSTPAFGETDWDDSCSKGTCRLERYPDSAAEEEARFARRADSVLSTLLHECVHILFRIGACSGHCGSAACERKWTEQLGRGGHGEAFLWLATMVERQARTQGLWDVSLELKTVAQSYYNKNERHLPEETVAFCWPGETVKYRDHVDKDGEGWVELVWESAS